MTHPTSQAEAPRRRRRAALIGLGLDGPPCSVRIVDGENCLLIGGSDQTRAELLETMQRLEVELCRIGRGLGDLAPDELAEIARRIDSPELEEIARRISRGLEEFGRSFHDSTPEELTALATPR